MRTFILKENHIGSAVSKILWFMLFYTRIKKRLIVNCYVTTYFFLGNSIGFLTEGERLNVALTRAKRSLILIANVATFQRKQMWKQLINDAYSRNVVFTPGAQTMESILGRSGI